MPNHPKQENKSMQKNKSVQYVTVDPSQSGRRIDNFLQLQLKGVPKSRIYQMIRKGEVRLNGCRVKQHQKIELDDVVRIPPVRMVEQGETPVPSMAACERLSQSIIFENELLLVLDKPSGLVVHSGSGQKFGVIDYLRRLRTELPFLELAHRLDRDTSGCLILVKDPVVLKEVQQSMQLGHSKKQYLAFVRGRLSEKKLLVDQPLKKNTLAGGERIVRIDPDGKQAKTLFHEKQVYETGSLLEVKLLTGRTHQIRAHAKFLNNPIAMDHKYGDRKYNKAIKKSGLKRLFLHAIKFELELPSMKKTFVFEAPLSDELSSFLQKA